ncbi:Rho-binding antiterminator [Moritella sp.]|uniref:Rho-binding antiterminator n=1 Tax=Moritella sp. TaxID=78556 RepID=UPI001DD217AC|nr:Rho-binding antiterminator [Moritella sp.]MCJ8349432.1 Rho-binding antiterminator [Moritella sp.]NQZ39252.1 Rho-binding antiterminator [Moritella sp.]
MMKCDQYDYIEIVCMHQYPIKLTLQSGAEVVGFGLDTKRNDNRDECIQMMIDGVISLVVLDTILTLEVTIDNPHFKFVTFD